jgi:predicted porin
MTIGNTSIAAVAALTILLTPGLASAYEVLGKRLEIYGVGHVSLDYQDSDTRHSVSGTRGRTTSGGEFGVSSNSTRLGFKGVIPLGTSPALSALFQFEQEIAIDRGGGDMFATRNSFVGLGTEWGDLLVGYYDTAFKIIGTDFTIWGDTIAERRNILGASPFNGNRMDVRYKNVAMYRFKSDTLQLFAQYSTDQQTQNAHDVDLNNNNSYAVGAEYTYGIFSVGVGYQWDRHDPAAGERVGGRKTDDTWGVRLGAAVDLDPVKISAIYEHVDAGDRARVDASGRPTSALGTLDRDAFGGSLQYFLTKRFSLGTQILHATKASGTKATEATMYSVGAWYDVTKFASVYLIGALTDNARNARYAIGDGGHGDRISTDFGKDPRSVSAGLVFKF